MEKETKRGNGIQEAKSSILFISTRNFSRLYVQAAFFISEPERVAMRPDMRIDDDVCACCPECRLGWITYEAVPREDDAAVSAAMEALLPSLRSLWIRRLLPTCPISGSPAADTVPAARIRAAGAFLPRLCIAACGRGRRFTASTAWWT